MTKLSSNPFDLSIVSPFYQSSATVSPFVEAVHLALRDQNLSYEIILVEDGGRDDCWNRIREVCGRDRRVKGIKLSRNFGQHYAITAGIKAAKGVHLAIMDCDLQDDPQYLPKLYEKACEGFEIVYARKHRREYPLLKNILSETFYFLVNRLIAKPDFRFPRDVGSFSLISRKVADAYISMGDFHRHYLVILRWLGFSVAYVDVIQQKRHSGQSSYTFSKLVRHALNGLVSQTEALLYLSIKIGFLMTFIGMLSIFYLVYSYLFGVMPGWTSLMVTLIFCTGLILMALGILGIYVGKIFEQTKGRPLYLIDQRLNFELESPISDSRTAFPEAH